MKRRRKTVHLRYLLAECFLWFTRPPPAVTRAIPRAVTRALDREVRLLRARRLHRPLLHHGDLESE